MDFDKTKHLAESTIKQRAQEREKIINQEREKEIAEKKKRELEEIKKAQERWCFFLHKAWNVCANKAVFMWHQDRESAF